MNLHHIGIIIRRKSQIDDFYKIFNDRIIQDQYVEKYKCHCYFLEKSKIEFILLDHNSPISNHSDIHHLALEVDDVEPFKDLISEKTSTELFDAYFLSSVIFSFPIEFIVIDYNKGMEKSPCPI